MVSKAIPKYNKTQFATNVLTGNPRANATAVNEAWTKGGGDGQISATLVNKLRAAMGLTGNLRPKRKKPGFIVVADLQSAGPKTKSQSVGGVAQPVSNGSRADYSASPARSGIHREIPENALEELEADIDRLIFRVMALGGSSGIEDALRQARRLLYGAFSRKPG